MRPGAVRLGLRYVKGLRESAAPRARDREAARPFASVADVAARAGVNERRGADAGGDRRARRARRHGRRDLWAAACRRRGRCSPTAGAAGIRRAPLTEMNADERLAADYAGPA